VSEERERGYDLSGKWEDCVDVGCVLGLFHGSYTRFVIQLPFVPLLPSHELSLYTRIHTLHNRI